MTIDIRAKDTIYALATPSGQSALAIIRLSGDKVYNIAEKIFPHKKHIKNFTAQRASLYDKNQNLIDESLFIYYPSPKSFTGQDMLEINSHGNPIIIDQILHVLKEHGARLAQPGEFSLRAVLNNKINLAQAENIADLIHAASPRAKELALRGMGSELFKRLNPVKNKIIDLLAQLEARMDFPEDDLGDYSKNILLEKFDTAIKILQDLLDNAAVSLRLYQGIRIVICGKPNAGKSTLINAILNENRALVHNSPGTTRDVVEGQINFLGVSIVFVDVAGIRSKQKADPVEQMGIDKAFSELEKAQGVIWLEDATSDSYFTEESIRQKLTSLFIPIIKVLNKIELLPDNNYGEADIGISAINKNGINDLLHMVYKRLSLHSDSPRDLFITKARHRDELYNCLSRFKDAKHAFKLDLADEVICSELRLAGSCFDRLFGGDLSEEVLDKIFSEFCIGK